MADERRDRGQGRPEGGRQGDSRRQGGSRPGEARPQDGRPQDQRQGDSRQADSRQQEGRQGDSSRQGRRFGRRRFGRQNGGQQGTGQQGGNGQPQEARRPAPVPQDIPPLPKMEPVACPLCGKPVYDLSTALSADREKPAPAHFDCVVERVAAAESLGPNERLVYLGSGAFGVVEFKDKSETAFTVKRRIQWEKEGDKQDWRKALSARIAHL